MTVYNFSAGPAMLPVPVMERVKEEFLNFNNMGASVIEISHRSKEFEAVLAATDDLFRKLTGLPNTHEILYCHGGAQMQFSMVPMNLLLSKHHRKALYVETGNFAKLARVEAEKFGTIHVVADGAENNYSEIPAMPALDEQASYVHITSNNTLVGTRWHEFPETGPVPLVVDATSEILSRKMDYSKFGLLYAGTQKNLGPSGMSMALVRKDLIGHSGPFCPKLMDYKIYQDNHSMANTPNTFAIYMIYYVLQWLEEQGGVEAMEKLNGEKAETLYQAIDASDFYKGTAHKDHRSHMNATFVLPTDELLQKFLSEALDNGLYALKGHRLVGGARASMYNAMPIEGVQKLVEFMKEFERTNG